MTSGRRLLDSVTRLVAVHPPGLDTVVIDLSQATTLAAAGAAALRAAAQACTGALTIRVVVADELMLRALQLTGAGELSVYPGLEQALAAGQACDRGALACALSVWPGYALITVTGECDVTTAALLRQILHSAPSRQAPRIIVSLAGLRFLDSAGLHTLLSARNDLAKDNSTALTVVAPQQIVAHVLSLTGADQLIPVYGTLAEAVADSR